MKKYLFLFCFIPALVLGAGSAGWAQTPDGDPPSVEEVCDTQTGAAFGLCNAYCEAMDCDHENAQASPTACAKVAAKFENITGFAPPCVTPPPPPDTCNAEDACMGCEVGGELDACCAANGDPSPACDGGGECFIPGDPGNPGDLGDCSQCTGDDFFQCCNDHPGAVACLD